MSDRPMLRCAELSEAVGEPLGGTAVTARAWLLLEVPGAWPRDVSAEGVLPQAAEDAVRSWLEATPGGRLQFIRRPGRSGPRRLAFVVRAEPGVEESRRIELADLDDLSAETLLERGEPTGGSLVLVCAHGSRDRCCSLRGTAVFGVLARNLGEEELWISSHLGGHRFAANVVVLPAGLQFGRVTPQEAPYLVARALGGRIELDRYRGRTSYDAAVQAAEQAVRTAMGLDTVGDLEVVAHTNGKVRFRTWDGAEWEAVVDEVEGPPVAASCGDEPAPQRSLTARVVEAPA